MARISMPQGRGSQMHNRREYELYGRPLPDNIDASRTHENVTLVDIELKQAYKNVFEKEIEKYNKKQKRKDRRITLKEYMAKIENNDKQQLFYEDVVQYGDKDDYEQHPELREQAKEALIEIAKTFIKENPQLYVIGAYIHMDEASPHLHLDYIPIAHGYKRGLETQNGLDKAFKQMGYKPEHESKKNNATKMWKDTMRKEFGNIFIERGMAVEEEMKSERQSLSVDEYKRVKEIAKEKAQMEIQKELDNVASHEIEIEKTMIGDYYKGESVRKLKDENKMLSQKNALLEDKNEYLGAELKRKQCVNVDRLETKAMDLELENQQLSWQLNEIEELKSENIELKKQVASHIQTEQVLTNRLKKIKHALIHVLSKLDFKMLYKYLDGSGLSSWMKKDIESSVAGHIKMKGRGIER